MSSKIDLTGRRFGKLTALHPTEKRMDGGSVVWMCRCDCGKLAEVSAKRLTRGKARSCGCLSKPNLKDYIGKRFGRLTVLEYAGTASTRGKAGTVNFWKCRCDCGEESVVSQTELQSGGTQSCGCLPKERTREGMVLVENTSVTILERIQRNPQRKNSTSGHVGVSQRKDGTWTAYINFQKKRYDLGRFKNKDDAIRAREQGEEMHESFLEWYHSTHKDAAGVSIK